MTFHIPKIHTFPDIPDYSKIIFPLKMNYGIFKDLKKFPFFQSVTADSYFQLETPFKLENIHHFVDFSGMIQLFNPIQNIKNIQRFMKNCYNGSLLENSSNSLIFTVSL